jgi:hypothetical protein
MPPKGTTTGADLYEYEEVKKVVKNLYIPIQKLAALVTDGAPSMVGRNSGVSSSTNLLILQENLCSESLRITSVVAVVSNFTNFVRSERMNHQFKDILSNMEAVRRRRLLCRGRMLKREYILKSEIELFLETKEKPSPQLCNHDWMCDFAFCIDIA